MKIYISEESAQKYYRELIENYAYNTEYLYNKVPTLKNLMEDQILKEVTGRTHFKKPYESGQLKWLIDNIEKRNLNGDIISGFVLKDIITGCEHLYEKRSVAEHKKEIDRVTYLSFISTLAKTINHFSKVEIPKEIKDICEGKPQSVAFSQSPKEDLSLNLKQGQNEKKTLPLEKPNNESFSALTWEEYYYKIKSETCRGVTEIYKRRIATIKFIKLLFEQNNVFCSMGTEERQFIAGTATKYNSCYKDAFNLNSLELNSNLEDWVWFGNMGASGYFKQYINENNEKISLALDEIPLGNHIEITKEHYVKFCEIYTKIFSDKAHGTATRLLSMKRPDVFVCIDGPNKENICKGFGIKRAVIDLKYYWDEILPRVHYSNWWKSSEPIGNDKEEKIIWNARAAFLDSLSYNETNIDNQGVK